MQNTSSSKRCFFFFTSANAKLYITEKMFESNAQIYRGKTAPLNYVAWRCQFSEQKNTLQMVPGIHSSELDFGTNSRERIMFFSHSWNVWIRLSSNGFLIQLPSGLDDQRQFANNSFPKCANLNEIVGNLRPLSSTVILLQKMFKRFSDKFNVKMLVKMELL